MSRKQNPGDVDQEFCAFCFKPCVAEVTHHTLDHPVPVCGDCARDVRHGRKTLSDVKDRVDELREIGVLT